MFGMSTRWSLLQGFGMFFSILTISVPAQAQLITVPTATDPGFISIPINLVGEAIEARAGSRLRPPDNINLLFSLPPTNEWEALLSTAAWFDDVKFGCSASSLLTIVGRGGLPPSPYESLSTDVIWSDTRLASTTSQYRSEKPSTKPSSAHDAVKIVPATGWVFDGKGHVTLISHASNANNLGSTPACQKR